MEASQAPGAGPQKLRWTAVGAPAAERRVEDDLGWIRDAARVVFGRDLVALVLLGSYGRQDGGFVEGPNGPEPCNDYDLVAVVRGNARGWRSACLALEAQATARLGVHAEFWPIGARELRPPPRTLLWLDAAHGHRVLSGDPAALDAVREMTVRDVPLDEAGRLLANRAVGLALSRHGAIWRAPAMRLRHGHKSVLACGDAILLGARRWAPRRSERLALLQSLRGAPAIDDALLAAYADAVEFGARPDRWSPPDAAVDPWFDATVAQVARWHLAFEARRLGAPTALDAYALTRGPLYPQSGLRTVRGVLSALASVARGSTPMHRPLMHPRERIARAAVLLAYGAEAEFVLADRLLGTPPDSEARCVALQTLARVGG